MTSTNVTIGLGDRSGSRVLKPPGGGSVLSFGGDEEVRPNPPRPKYDQQNSSNLFGCMGGSDPTPVKNEKSAAPAAQAATEAAPQAAEKAAEVTQEKNSDKSGGAPPPEQTQQQGSRGRVPPGGFSAGFW
ncbi:jupiter microtubule associated homolog 1 [Lutzomyia longipalpis]|uniref:Microtubule-associated protein Jupiter n=1 Tax=Lutzomyia longipalpis TaxID=7200 RepID=A0A1B0GIK2_LUTLO|nr:jupiter microtubule associated homolog 1 [Lutzomyia longipalpis]